MLRKILFENVNNYWRNIDKAILICFVMLFILGIFFSFSSTSTLAGERLNKDYYFFFTKHLVFSCLALFLMIFISNINLKIINSLVTPLFIICFLLLICVPFFGLEVKGSKRWLDFYLFRFQPIELVKPFFILITAKILSNENLKKNTFSYLLSFFVLLSVITFLILQPDLGQSILLVCTWISIIFISGVSILIILSFLGISVVTLSSLVIIFPERFGYIIKRFVSFLDPTKGDSFQSQKALDAIKQGGLKGQGMGEGILKESVPEAHTDYIIAVISEEFGSLISISLVILFLYISYRIIKFTIFEKNRNIKISLCGLTTLLIFQTFIHIGVNTSLLPTTGMTLPFLSYGGSSLLGSGVIAGIILNFTRSRSIYE